MQIIGMPGSNYAYTERKFSLEFQFHYFANGNSLNLNSAYYYVFSNLFMMAYITEIQKSKLVILNLVNLTNLSQIAKFNSVHILILKGPSHLILE